MNLSSIVTLHSEKKYNSSNLFKLIAHVTTAIRFITWEIDRFDWTPPSRHCRTQRKIIGVLGVLLLALPILNHWIEHYLSAVLGGYGFVVAAMQHFNGWSAVFKHVYIFGNPGPWFFDEMMLSGAAMLIVTLQILLAFFTFFEPIRER